QDETVALDKFLESIRHAKEYLLDSKNLKYGIGILPIEESFENGTYKGGLYIGSNFNQLTAATFGGAQATYGIKPEGIRKLFNKKMEVWTPSPTLLQEYDILREAQEAADNIMREIQNIIKTDEPDKKDLVENEKPK